jgi:hypothetical protein
MKKIKNFHLIMGQSHSGYEEITQQKEEPLLTLTFQQLLEKQSIEAAKKKRFIVQE